MIKKISERIEHNKQKQKEYKKLHRSELYKKQKKYRSKNNPTIDEQWKQLCAKKELDEKLSLDEETNDLYIHNIFEYPDKPPSKHKIRTIP